MEQPALTVEGELQTPGLRTLWCNQHEEPRWTADQGGVGAQEAQQESSGVRCHPAVFLCLAKASCKNATDTCSPASLVPGSFRSDHYWARTWLFNICVYVCISPCKLPHPQGGMVFCSYFSVLCDFLQRVTGYLVITHFVSKWWTRIDCGRTLMFLMKLQEHHPYRNKNCRRSLAYVSLTLWKMAFSVILTSEIKKKMWYEINTLLRHFI